MAKKQMIRILIGADVKPIGSQLSDYRVIPCSVANSVIPKMLVGITWSYFTNL